MLSAVSCQRADLRRDDVRAVSVALISERRRLRGSCRILLGCDSDVVCGVLSKGRSSSRRLNVLVRKLVVQLLFSGAYPGLLRTPTDQNTDDAPSRRRTTRKGPLDAAPEWAARFVAGKLDEFDQRVHVGTRGEWCMRAIPTDKPQFSE